MKNRAIVCKNGANCHQRPGNHDVSCKGDGCKISWKHDGDIKCEGEGAHCAHKGTSGRGYLIFLVHLASHSAVGRTQFFIINFFSLLEHFTWVLLTVPSVQQFYIHYIIYIILMYIISRWCFWMSWCQLQPEWIWIWIRLWKWIWMNKGVQWDLGTVLRLLKLTPSTS